MTEAVLKTPALSPVSDTLLADAPSCAVLVVSCDRYRDLWMPFFRLFWQHWPDCPFPVYLGTNYETLDEPRLEVLNAGPDESWSKSLRFFLSQLSTDYVLLLLEDFFFDGPISNGAFVRNLQALDALRGTVLRLHPNPPANLKLNGYANIGELHRRAPYRVSAQPAIWNRVDLMRCLKDGESAWDFEKQGTLRSQNTATGYYCTFRSELPYRHVVEQGQWFWSAAKRYGAQNIGCDFALRPVMKPSTAAKKAVNVLLRRLSGRLAAFRLNRKNHGLAPAQAAINSFRVAFLTNMIPPYHKPVLDALARRNRQMRVFISTPMEVNRPWKLEWGGLDVVVQKTLTVKGRWRHPRGFSEPLSVHFPLDTIQQLRRFRPHVVISAEMGARTLLAMLYRKMNPASRLIVWAEAAESTERGRGLARELTRKVVCRNVDAFLAVGASSVKYLRGLGADQKSIFKIAYTTEVAKFAARSLARTPDSARRMLFSGQLVERKGLLPFLAVLAEWAAAHPDRRVECQFAGEGPLRQALGELPMPPNVSLNFLGEFQYDELPNLYRNAGVLVLPTLADTWGVVVNEALAAGLPVLGSVYAQAVEELVVEGLNGWTFRPDRQDEMFAAIDRMMNTSLEELDRMRSRARTAALNLSPHRVAGLIDMAVSACLRSLIHAK